MAREECAICGCEFEVSPETFTAGKTGEPICPSCKGVEDQAEVVDL